MSEGQLTAHRYAMMGGLVSAAATLPFSVKICHGAIIVVLISWLFEGQWSKKISIVQKSLLLQLLIFLFLWRAIGLILSDDLSRGLSAIEKHIFFLLLPLALATTSVGTQRADVKLILTSFVFACLAGTILCVIQAWREVNVVLAGDGTVNPYLDSSLYFQLHATESPAWLVLSYLSLSKGISMHPTYLALFISFSIVCILHTFSSLVTGVQRAIASILLLYFTLFVVFLSSRIMLVGLAAIFVFVLARSALMKQRSFSVMVIAMVSIFVLTLFLNPVSEYRSLEEIDGSTFVIEDGKTYTNAAQIRASLWWLAIRTIGETNPLFGAGTGDVDEVMTRTANAHQITNIIGSYDPHNQFLFTLIANGFPALLTLIFCLALPAWWALLQRDYLVLGFMFLMALVCITESAFEVQKGIVFYSLMSGLLFYHANSFQSVPITLRSLQRAG